MKKYYLLPIGAVLALAFAVYGIMTSHDTEKIRVLFIGNSLTYANNLPKMIAEIAKSAGHKIAYDSVTPGGSRLAQHAKNLTVLEKLQEEQWNFVVLQEQSQYSGFSEKQLKKDVFPFAASLAAETKKANPSAKIIFYMTMARKNGDPGNAHISSDLLTYNGMQKRVNRSYLKMAELNKAAVAPVGEVWETFRIKFPTIELYADNVHPNPTGTYLAACVFYSTFFAQPCTGTDVPEDVKTTTAEDIQNITDKIVFSSRQNWNWSPVPKPPVN